MHTHAQLTEISLPEFGLPTVEPVIPAETYRRRIARLYERMQETGYDVLVVYGDREHFANLTFLTGYDPRFEEALLVLNLPGHGHMGTAQKPVLLVGNEGLGYVNISPIKDDLEIVLYQSFSLLGQDRSRSRRISDILQSAGIVQGTRVGVAGWKHFGPIESDAADTWIEIPAYIVDTLRQLTGSPENVRNANAIFMDASRGLRATNEVEQLAQFEFAATFASQAVRNVVFGVQPGMTELEAVELMRLNGLPLSTHIFLAAGERAFLGMVSPTLRRIERADPFTTCCGLWGALTCRAGFIVESAKELPGEIADYVSKLVSPYFEAIVAWYEHVGIGVTGGELHRIIHEHIGDPFFNVSLNPGHLIHLDEWVNSPIYAGSQERLQAGMALQVDVIPATGTRYYTTNIEDGIALADDELRTAFAEHYPEAWERIQARRAFMQDVLGIRLRPEVLPFSNIPAYLPPFLLAPQRALRVV